MCNVARAQIQALLAGLRVLLTGARAVTKGLTSSRAELLRSQGCRPRAFQPLHPPQEGHRQVIAKCLLITTVTQGTACMMY